MSEQLVLILLIALTLAIVLIALTIPDEASADSGSINADPPATISATDEVSVYSDADHPQSAVMHVHEELEANDDDARRAADVPEEASR